MASERKRTIWVLLTRDWFGSSVVLLAALAIIFAVSHRSKNEKLLMAVRSRSIENIRQLLAGGANVNCVGHSGCTPLLVATALSDEQVVHLLLASNALPNVQSTNGWTPLMIATTNGNLTVVTNLLARGASITITNSDGMSAVELARQNPAIHAILKANLTRQP